VDCFGVGELTDGAGARVRIEAAGIWLGCC
jgi:hypothetical protein